MFARQIVGFQRISIKLNLYNVRIYYTVSVVFRRKIGRERKKGKSRVRKGGASLGEEPLRSFAPLGARPFLISGTAGNFACRTRLRRRRFFCAFVHDDNAIPLVVTACLQYPMYADNII